MRGSQAQFHVFKREEKKRYLKVVIGAGMPRKVVNKIRTIGKMGRKYTCTHTHYTSPPAFRELFQFPIEGMGSKLCGGNYVESYPYYLTIL